MSSHPSDPDTSPNKRVINITVTRRSSVPPVSMKKEPGSSNPTATMAFRISLNRRGGFVLDGRDGQRYSLMATRAGLNALQIFARMSVSRTASHGVFQPIYLSQTFFDQLNGIESTVRDKHH